MFEKGGMMGGKGEGEKGWVTAGFGWGNGVAIHDLRGGRGELARGRRITALEPKTTGTSITLQQVLQDGARTTNRR